MDIIWVIVVAAVWFFGGVFVGFVLAFYDIFISTVRFLEVVHEWDCKHIWEVRYSMAGTERRAPSGEVKGWDEYWGDNDA